jgi:hypothetical protein
MSCSVVKFAFVAFGVCEWYVRKRNRVDVSYAPNQAAEPPVSRKRVPS